MKKEKIIISNIEYLHNKQIELEERIRQLEIQIPEDLSPTNKEILSIVKKHQREVIEEMIHNE